MIVEFIGLPGSGKSTLEKCIYNEGECIGGKDTKHPLMELDSKKWIKRNLLKFFVILGYAVTKPKKTLEICTTIIESKQKNKYDYIRLIFNSLYIFYMYDTYKNSRDIIFFDEGLVHNSWAIRVNAIREFDVVKYYKIAGITSSLIIVNSNHEIIKTRIALRDNINERIKDIIDNIDCSSKSLDYCVRNIDDNRKLLLVNNNTNDLDKNISMIHDFLIKELENIHCD